MALASISGKPGTQSGFTATPIEIFWSARDQARFIPGPVTVDGTSSGNAANATYPWLLQAGQILGKQTSSGKYQTSVIGLTGATLTTGGTVLTLANTGIASEINRLFPAGTGTLIVTGANTANTTSSVKVIPVTMTTTCTGTTLGISATGTAAVSGSMIGVSDGSALGQSGGVYTVLCDLWGKKCVDAVNTTRTDVFDVELWAGGGIIDESKILPWPSDTGNQAYIKARIRDNIPDAKFKADLINS